MSDNTHTTGGRRHTPTRKNRSARFMLVHGETKEGKKREITKSASCIWWKESSLIVNYRLSGMNEEKVERRGEGRASEERITHRSHYLKGARKRTFYLGPKIGPSNYKSLKKHWSMECNLEANAAVPCESHVRRKITFAYPVIAEETCKPL